MASSKKLIVNMPGLARNAEVEVVHLGVFKNGTTNSVEDEQVKYWEHETGRTWPSDGTLHTFEEAATAVDSSEKTESEEKK